ncbi:MAG: hypothetical protein II539_03440 [Muribaculaceae bacterium]|nr:hypothetical protein [Muribaculaceae bacterium]
MTLKFSHKGVGTQSRAVKRADNYLDRRTEGQKNRRRKKAEGQKNRRFLRGEEEKGGERGILRENFVNLQVNCNSKELP